jgi:hypothetical protein
LQGNIPLLFPLFSDFRSNLPRNTVKKKLDATLPGNAKKALSMKNIWFFSAKITAALQSV